MLILIYPAMMLNVGQISKDFLIRFVKKMPKVPKGWSA